MLQRLELNGNEEEEYCHECPENVHKEAFRKKKLKV